MRILIIEDEIKLSDVIKTRLEQEKYIVDVSNNGEDGLDYALSNIYDLIILDVMLPGINGFDILKEITDQKIDSKVIMLTAKSLLDDKLNAFNLGANDYLTKPFHIDELVARINVQLRNDTNTNKDIIELNDIILNLKTLKLICTKTNEEIEISLKEFQIIEYFMHNSNQVLSKEQIYVRIWGIDNEIESNNLEVYLSFIRRKLKLIGSHTVIKAVRGIGYKIEVES